ncbi:MAG: hypothetical protein WCL00_12095, partial [Bacteroidota bacterium]
MSNLRTEYEKEKIDSVRIRILFDLASIYADFFDNIKVADSIGDLAIHIAEQSGNPLLKINAYNNFIERIPTGQNLRKEQDYARKAIKLSDVSGLTYQKWRSSHNLVAIYFSHKLYYLSAMESYRAWRIATKLNNPSVMVEAYLDLGKGLESNKMKPEALRNYLAAQTLAEEINDRVLLRKCYGLISAFYNLLNTFDKALEYKQKEQGLILFGSHSVDSVELMWSQNQKHIIISRFNNYLDDKIVEQVINYSIRTNNIRLRKFEFAVYRKHLIEADQLDKLTQVYNQKYPDELIFLWENDREMYYRLKAFFKIQEHQNDSALFYFKQAELIISGNPNRIYCANFYLRLGHFLKRIDRPREAIESFMNAYRFAREDSWFGNEEFVLKASQQLSGLYALIKDYQNAYFFSVKNRWL